MESRAEKAYDEGRDESYDEHGTWNFAHEDAIDYVWNEAILACLQVLRERAQYVREDRAYEEADAISIASMQLIDLIIHE